VVLALSLLVVPSWGQGKQGKGAQAEAKQAKQANTAPPEPTPRWPDGTVNLGSVPGKKGYWEVRPGLGGFPRANDVPFQSWAKAVYEFRTATFSQDSPLVDCKAAPGPSFLNAPGFEIVDVPELKSIFILNMAGPHSWRVIYMDGRAHPQGNDLRKADDVRPTYLGHSIGHWEVDTLVIDSVGFNEKMWAVGAFPNTSQLHLVERISRPNLKTLSYEVTVDDPGAYTKSWSGKWTITETTGSKWIPNGEMFEYICEDAGR
jgi:hypothetical protein